MKGMVRQRGKTWTAYWWTPNPVTGDWTQRSKGDFATKTTAQKHFTATLAKVHIGEWSPESKLTVRELLTDHWLPTRSSEGLRATTLAQYRDVIDQWIVPGRAHKGKRILVLVADLDIRVIDENGVTLRHLELDPSVDYQGRVRDIV